VLYRELEAQADFIASIAEGERRDKSVIVGVVEDGLSRFIIVTLIMTI